MAQVDMKRFYIGCGESLQVHSSALMFSGVVQPLKPGRQLS